MRRGGWCEGEGGGECEGEIGENELGVGVGVLERGKKMSLTVILDFVFQMDSGEVHAG